MQTDAGPGESLLYTDFYQLTMAQTYFEEERHDKPARFEHFFRSYPDYGDHQAGYCVNAGMSVFLDWLEDARLTEDEHEYLRDQTTPEGNRMFSDEFLEWLADQRPYEELTIEAIPEGRIVHPHEPLTVVHGPLALAQLVETPLLNYLNYQTLIATKAARIHEAGEGNLLLEFGMRRAHERAANAGARAALIGGADFTSNTEASREMGYPPKGTHAHSLVQSYLAEGKSEREAFEAFARSYPENCILLVDTIDTLESGVPNAIEVFEDLRERGHEPVGIRLDSGDLAHLAVRSARMLNDAGFEETSIVISNQLDERVITQIINQIRAEAPDYDLDPDSVIGRLSYGVGTRMITSRGESSLGGVYKLVSLKSGGEWQPAMKISENPEKIPNPGIKDLYRIYDDRDRATADLIGLRSQNLDESETINLRHPYHEQSKRSLNTSEISGMEPLLETVLENGSEPTSRGSIEDFRDNRRRDLERLDEGVKRIVNPHIYHVSLSEELWEVKKFLQYRMKAMTNSG